MATNYEALAAPRTPMAVFAPGSRMWLDGQVYQMDITIDRNGLDVAQVQADISSGPANEFVAWTGSAIGTGTNMLRWEKAQSILGTQAEVIWANIPSGAGISAAFPQSVSSGTTTGILIDTSHPWTRLITGTESLRCVQGPGANSDTLRILASIRILDTANLPILTIAGGPNTSAYLFTGFTLTFPTATKGISTDAFRPVTSGPVVGTPLVGSAGAFSSSSGGAIDPRGRTIL